MPPRPVSMPTRCRSSCCSLPVKTEVPFGELSGIGAGYIFDLKQAAHGHVEIRANGEPIGHGELVEIDGRVGVRILKCT